MLQGVAIPGRPGVWQIWRCRLQSSGIVQLVDGPCRVLHRAPGLADTEAEEAANAAKARAAALRAQAERALRMARVLAAGGFHEEVPPLLAKAIGHGGAARLAALGELPADVTSATAGQMRELVDRKALPFQAMTALDALAAAAGTPSGTEIECLLEATDEALAACVDGREAMAADSGA